MNKISIIGCGWLGFPLARFLVQKGFEVKGSTTSQEKLARLDQAGIEPFQIIAGPTLEGEKLSLFFDSEILIINIPPRRRRENVEDLHVQEVKNIIDLAVKSKVQKIIFCSSTGVYPDTNDVVTEQTKTKPSTGSTKALVRIEAYLSSQPEVQSTVLRFSGLAGANRKAGRFLAGRKNLRNGQAPVNLVHLDDCVQVIYQVIRQEAWGEIFNVCTDEHPLRADFYTQQAKKLGMEAPSFLQDDELSYKIVSNEKLKRNLNYQFIYPDPTVF